MVRIAAVTRLGVLGLSICSNLVLTDHRPTGAQLFHPSKYLDTAVTEDHAPTTVAQRHPTRHDHSGHGVAPHATDAADSQDNHRRAGLTESRATQQGEGSGRPKTTSLKVGVLATFTRWDSAWFLKIAEQGGYTTEES